MERKALHNAKDAAGEQFQKTDLKVEKVTEIVKRDTDRLFRS
jgi:hypothetical protein